MADEPKPHDGPKGVTYHHVGTGVTDSNYWCATCDGWYGVPHDNVHTGRWKHQANHCVCGVCQKANGIWPKQGMFATHAEYRRQREQVA